MPRLKTRPNLRQEFRELIVRANALNIEAKLARGYLKWTDNITSPTEIKQHELWADEKVLQQFREAINLAEQIAAERPEVEESLTCPQSLFEKAGIQVGILNPWWFYYEIEESRRYSPLLKSSQLKLFDLAFSVIKKLPPA